MKPVLTDTDRPGPGAAEIGQRAALLGHDIRNAVADILGGLAQMDATPLDPVSQRQLQRIRSASEQLARLSDEVLSLISGDVEARTETPSNLRLDMFLDDLQARWSAHAQEKGLHFGVERSRDLPLLIGCDRGALERILSNLIGNAMKHTRRGEVTLAARMSARESLQLVVRDTGPGFSEAALKHLFEAGGAAHQGASDGTGLGLHIVRNLTDQLGGAMRVSIRPTGGAKVAVNLPRAAWAPGLEGAQTIDLPDLAGQTVLVAEDNQTNQLLVRQMLESLGGTCTLAGDGEVALARLRSEHYDLALIDIEMPRLSGLDLIRELRRMERQHPGRPVLPVLAITAYVLNANRTEIYEAGADGILAKPIMSLEAFGQAIAKVLAKRDGTTEPVASDAPLLDPTHLDRLIALAGERDGKELLDRLVQDFRTALDGIRSGLDDVDHALLRARTHVLISLAGAVGAAPLQTLAEQLNAAAHARDPARITALAPAAVDGIEKVLSHLCNERKRRFVAGTA